MPVRHRDTFCNISTVQALFYCTLQILHFFLQIEGKTLHQQKNYDSLKAQIMVSIFSNKLFFIKVCGIIFFRNNAIAHLIVCSVV